MHEHESGGRVGERKTWFGRDGRLVALPDPTLRAPTRPEGPREDEDEDEGLSVFCPPNLPMGREVAGTEQPGLVRTSGGAGGAGRLAHCQLEVDVTSVVFDHHHLFSLEHHLVVRLSHHFDAYQRVVSRRRDLRQDRRLALLYDAVDELREKLEICVQKAERDFQVSRGHTWAWGAGEGAD